MRHFLTDFFESRTDHLTNSESYKTFDVRVSPLMYYYLHLVIYNENSKFLMRIYLYLYLGIYITLIDRS